MAGRRKSETETEKPPSAVQGDFPLTASKDEGYYLRTTLSRLHYGGEEGDADAIGMIQKFLDVPVTGTYDEATVQAVYAYQKKAKLPVTGIVDKKTWDRMAK